MIDQVRAIAGDEGLRDEIVRQATEAVADQKEEFETQRKQLTRQLSPGPRRDSAGGLGADANSSTTARMADLQQRISKAERSLSVANKRIAEIDRQKISADDVTEAFTDFDRVWNSLTIREQSELLGLLVARSNSIRAIARSRFHFIPAASNPLTSCKPRKSSDNDQAKTQCQRGGSRSQDDPAPQSR